VSSNSRDEPGGETVSRNFATMGSLGKADYAPHTDGLGYLAGYNRGDDPKQTGRVIAVMPQSADKINTRSLGRL